MSRLNAEGHDESQYLPKIFNSKTGKYEQVPPVNPFRAAKADIFRNDDDQIEAGTWMPRILNRMLDETGKNKLIDDDQLHTCKRIERAAISALAILGLSDLRVFMAGYDGDLSKLPQNDPFTALLTGIKLDYSNAIFWVISDQRNRGNVNLAKYKMLPSIHTGLEFAKKILDDLNKSDNMQIVASPELRPESAHQLNN